MRSRRGSESAVLLHAREVLVAARSRAPLLRLAKLRGVQKCIAYQTRRDLLAKLQWLGFRSRPEIRISAEMTGIICDLGIDGRLPMAQIACPGRRLKGYPKDTRGGTPYAHGDTLCDRFLAVCASESQ